MRSILLSPFGWLYGVVGIARQNLYRRGLCSSADLGVRTISVGNITVGGTGKTPLVAFIAESLAKKGEKVCILTRGYGRDDPQERVLVSDGQQILADVREAGDEPFELAKSLLGKAVIVADAKRSEAGIWAQKNFGITTFILDDGFQHLQVKRDLDLVLLDATNPFGNHRCLPAGILRESLQSLKRADAVVITRANLVDDVSEIENRVAGINPVCKIFVSRNKFTDLIRLKDFLAVSEEDRNHETENRRQKMGNLKFMAFCALGNPDNFFSQLRREDFDLVHTKAFSDHHVYKQSEIRNIEKEAVRKRAEVLLTTAKDAVKLKHLTFNFPCFVVKNGLTFSDESAFIDLIQNPKVKN